MFWSNSDKSLNLATCMARSSWSIPQCGRRYSTVVRIASRVLKGTTIHVQAKNHILGEYGELPAQERVGSSGPTKPRPGATAELSDEACTAPGGQL